MPLPLDPAAAERQSYLDLLGMTVDDSSLSLADLKKMTAGGANVSVAADTAGLPGVFGIDGNGNPYYDPDMSVPQGERAMPQIVNGSVVLVKNGSNYPLVTSTQADTNYAKSGRDVSIWDYNPPSNGVGNVDDSAAIQAAINAAGIGGIVRFPKGTFGQAVFQWGLTTGIPALPLSQVWQGSGVSKGNGSGAGYGKCGIYFPNLAAGQEAIQMSVSCEMTNMWIRGPGVNNTGRKGVTNRGSANAHVIMRNVCFYDWDVAMTLDASYYSAFYDCEWRHNNLGLDLVNVCYNVCIYHPRFDGSGANIVGNATPGYGTCIRYDAVNGLKIYGGSIESYGSRLDVVPQAGILQTNKVTRSSVTLHDVYWESACDKASGWDITGCKNVVFRIIGGDVGLNNHDSWGNYTGVTDCNVKMDSINVFGTDPSTTAPKFISGPLTNPANSRVEVDNIGWYCSITGAVFDNAALGVNSPRVVGQIPDLYTGSGSGNNKWRFMGTGIKVPNSSTVSTGSGATASRPASLGAGAGVGSMWFDTTLNKPIWWDGAAWRDATGAVV